MLGAQGCVPWRFTALPNRVGPRWLPEENIMLELKDGEGNPIGRTFVGHTVMEATRQVFQEFGIPEMVGLLPAGTREPGTFSLMALMWDSNFCDSGLRLVDVPDVGV